MKKLTETYVLKEAPIAPQDAGKAVKLKPVLDELNNVIYHKLGLLLRSTPELTKVFYQFSDDYSKLLDGLDKAGFSSILPGDANAISDLNKTKDTSPYSSGVVLPAEKMK